MILKHSYTFFMLITWTNRRQEIVSYSNNYLFRRTSVNVTLIALNEMHSDHKKKSCSINRFYAFKCYLPIHACNERDNLLDLLQNDDYLLKIGRGHLIIFHPWNKCVDKRLLIELKNSFVSWTIYFLGFVLVNIIL